MVIVAGYIDVADEDRQRYLAARREAIRATRDEPGCLEYVFSADAEHGGRVRIFERWETPDDLRAHLEVLAARAEPATTPAVVGRQIWRYEAGPAEEL